MYQDISLKQEIRDLCFPDSISPSIVESLRTPAMIAPLDAIVLKLKIPFIDQIIEQNFSLYCHRTEQLKKQYPVYFPEFKKEEKLHIRNMVALSKNRDIL